MTPLKTQRWRNKNRDKVNEYMRKWRANHREVLRLSYKKYRTKNRELCKQKDREYYYTHLESVKKYNKNRHLTYNRLLREKLFHTLDQHICQICGEFDKRCLQFDHKNGGGRLERVKFGNSVNFYRYYINHKEEAMLKLQVYCSNCNWKKMYSNSELRRW